jgi:Fic family protein
MTAEQNIFVAKRNIVDYIWKSAKLEGLSVTYPDTDAIYNGMSVQGVPVSDIVAVNNLKRAWEFLLTTLDPPLDYAYVCKINQILGGDNLIYNAGYIRNVPVSIGGTSWKPEMPIESKIKEEIADINAIPETTDKAITFMLWAMRRQMFLDGNKRAAQLIANKEMIANGAGIISIPIERQDSFRRLLLDFYESNNMENMKDFVYDYCIDGIDFEREGSSKRESDNRER